MALRSCAMNSYASLLKMKGVKLSSSFLPAKCIEFGSFGLNGGGFLGARVQTANIYMRSLSEPKKYDDIVLPDQRRLRIMLRMPVFLASERPQKMFKRLIDIRGPELVHNKLIYKQYGIQALSGGNLRWGHIEMMRLTINRNMEESRMFGAWRIDAPWKPITKKGQGQRMGGGKGPINHYVTPVKGERMVVEVGGHCEFEEVFPFLHMLAKKLPFKARAVSQEMLDLEEKIRQDNEKRNVNPFTFEYMATNNCLNSSSFLGRYDYKWFGKYR